MMEWKSLSILAFICQLAGTFSKGYVGVTPRSVGQEKNLHHASVVMCHHDQTFFCINLTHYSPCIHLDLTDLINSTMALSQEAEFYCGTERCCQVGGDSPCTYRCQRQPLAFESPRIPWSFPPIKKKKKKRTKKEPLTSEEVDRLNKIVSVKSFIIRQKDLEDWDYDGDYISLAWRPSYRTFCPLKVSYSHVYNQTCTSIASNSKDRITQIRSTSTTTQVTVVTTTTTRTTTTTTRTTTTTTQRATTRPTTKTTARPTTRKTTTKPTTRKTTTRPTTRKTTTRPTTKKPTPKKATPHITRRTPKPTKIVRTLKPKPKPTRRTPKPPRKTGKPLAHSLPCNATYLNKRTFVPGSCEAYFECVRFKGKYHWKIFRCKTSYFFDSGTSQCTRTGNANCDIINPDAQAGRGKRWDERIVS